MEGWLSATAAPGVCAPQRSLMALLQDGPVSVLLLSLIFRGSSRQHQGQEFGLLSQGRVQLGQKR